MSAADAARYVSETSCLTDKVVPEMIVVGIVNVNRDRDFTPTDGKKMATLWTKNVGKAELTARFLKNELKTFINSNYRTSGYDIITGWSYGGLFTMYSLFHHPELFDAYIAVSPSLWWDQECPESSGALAATGDIYREKGEILNAIDYYERANALEKSREEPDVRVIEHNEQVIRELKKTR